ncbi:DUF4293 domain-containing protein [Ferruginibacter sp.]|nr:DUF4293 domain-containing protein [Ferruginibacter sp.]
MIQRIQSVWLLLAAICLFLTYKLPFYVGTNAKGTVEYNLTGTENFLLMLVTFLTGALAAVTIFLFKKRILQLRLCVLGIVIEALLIFLYYTEVKTFTTGTYALWAILHSVVVISFFLAAKAINKDEKLIKDSDRLR